VHWTKQIDASSPRDIAHPDGKLKACFALLGSESGAKLIHG